MYVFPRKVEVSTVQACFESYLSSVHLILGRSVTNSKRHLTVQLTLNTSHHLCSVLLLFFPFFKQWDLLFSPHREKKKNPALKEGLGVMLETRISYFILEHPSNALTITLQDLSNQPQHSSNHIAS